MTESPSHPLALPTRDYFLLPLVSLLTAILLSGVAELLARRTWVEQERDSCVSQGRHKPNCVTFMKNIEGPWVRYATNACGYRGTDYCGPKRPGTWRAVIMGTSIAYGLHVPFDDFFSTVAAPELHRIFRRPIEFENMGDIEPLWVISDDTYKEMAALKPDAVFLVIAPFDLARTEATPFRAQRAIAGRAPEAAGLDWTQVRLFLRESRFLFMVQHFMLDDQKFFLRAFENYADPVDPSRSPVPPEGEKRFELMNTRVQHFAEAAHATGAKAYLIALPNRAQCALVGDNIQIPHLDPFIFSNRLREMADKAGINYIDVIPILKNTPKAEKLFYAVDGHPGAGANHLMTKRPSNISNAIQRSLRGDSVSPLGRTFYAKRLG